MPAVARSSLLAVELSGTIPPGTIAEGSARSTGVEAAATPSGVDSGSDWTPLDWTTISLGWTWAQGRRAAHEPDGWRASSSRRGAGMVAWTVTASRSVSTT